MVLKQQKLIFRSCKTKENYTMAEVVTDLYVKKIDTEEFKKWIEKETNARPYYDSVKKWNLYASFEEGYGGYFWEALALKMIKDFKEIVFECNNQVIWDDHLVGTSCKCNGKEVTITRYIELPPSDFDDEVDEEYEAEYDEEYKAEIDSMRNLFEAENGIPYLVKFSVKEVINCFEIYDLVGKKLKDSAFVDAACAKQKTSKEKFMEFIHILDFKNRQ
jgi:hypothetical protein